jgi:hypothetical protein
VKDFGAVGDGRTDDTAAFQAALAHASTLMLRNDNRDSQQAGGVTVNVPVGSYNISDTLVLVTGVCLNGSGKTSSVLQNLTTNKTLIRNDSGAVYNAFGGGISNLALYGNRGAATQWGIDLLRPLSTVVENVYIQNMGAGGCRVRQGLSSEFRHVYVVKCAGPGFLTGEGIESWESPVVLPTHYPTNGVTFSECHAVRNESAGFTLGPYTNGCTIRGGASEYNYESAGENRGYNVELLSTGSYLSNVVVDLWCEGPAEAHVMMNAGQSSNRLVRLKHFGGGTTGVVDRAVIVKSGILHLDAPVGHGDSYRAIRGSVSPFRLHRAGPAVIHLTNPQGSMLTRESAWVEDEVGETTDLANNLYQSASGVVRGAAPKVYTAATDAGPEWLREGDAQPYLRVEPFYGELTFGDGKTSPNVGFRQLAERTVGLGERDSPRYLQLGSAWNGNHALLGENHLWVDQSGNLRIKNEAPTHDFDGVIVGAQAQTPAREAQSQN